MEAGPHRTHRLTSPRRRSIPWVAVLIAFLVGAWSAGCKSGPTPAERSEPDVVEQPTEPTSVTIRFVLADSVVSDLDVPARGTLRGAIFHTEDVGAFGPKKGAKAVTKIEPAPIDLTDPERPTWTTEPLAPGEYTFLGFVDLDENSSDGPDDGDIVTRPATNRFVPAEAPETLDVRFDYIKGSTIFGSLPARPVYRKKSGVNSREGSTA